MKSILREVIKERVNERTKDQFIRKVAKQSGITEDKLSEVYTDALTEAKTLNVNPITLAKARVYSFVKENKNESPLYRIWDTKEKTWVGKPYNNRRRAASRADKLDLQYGAVRYIVKILR